MYLSKKTKKLFFDRYLYKIAVRTPMAKDFRGNDLDKTRSAIDAYKDFMLKDGSTETYIGHSWNRVRVRLDEVYRELAFTVLLESQSDSMIRVEGNTLSFYTNDESAIETVAELYDTCVKEIAKPENDKIREFLLANPKSIIREEFTHKYKVTINPLDDETAFKQWAKQLPKIKILRNNYRLGGYFYVADLKTLSMCRLFLSNKIRRIDELRSYEEI
jgi:hypothetical protein